MKLKTLLPVTALLLLISMGSCTKDAATSSSTATTSADQLTLKSGDAGHHSSSESKDHSNGGGTVTPPVSGAQQAAVNLGVAGNFAILSKTGVTDVYKSTITGDVGSSPISGAAILVRCTEVAGSIYSVNAAGPLPCRITNPSMLTTAVSNMQTAYTDAAGRTNPNFLNLGAGNIGGKTLTAGLYKWTTALNIPTNITISGGANDIFIFQVAGTLRMSSAVRITLIGGAQAKNIFWQVAGAVTLGT